LVAGSPGSRVTRSRPGRATADIRFGAGRQRARPAWRRSLVWLPRWTPLIVDLDSQIRSIVGKEPSLLQGFGSARVLSILGFQFGLGSVRLRYACDASALWKSVRFDFDFSFRTRAETRTNEKGVVTAKIKSSQHQCLHQSQNQSGNRRR